MTKKSILITGATDGIGLETAKVLVALGHHVLLHGRNAAKLSKVEQALTESADDSHIESYVADLSRMNDVAAMAEAISQKHATLDVLINNAGVFVIPDPVTPDGLDLRFIVNAIAPYYLTQQLLPLLGKTSRVINLSSAAQARVNIDALLGKRRLDNNEAYAQSKLALTAWSHAMAESLGTEGPAIIAVNPGSFLGSKMVQEAYGTAGKDLGIGAKILTRAALDDEFASASGKYFDNDSGHFASPHLDVLDTNKTSEIVQAIEAVLAVLLNA